MPVEVSASRSFICDVPDCGKKEVIAIVGDLVATKDDVPFGWHVHQNRAEVNVDAALHCPDHRYRWNPDGDFFEAIPKIRRPRKNGGAE